MTCSSLYQRDADQFAAYGRVVDRLWSEIAEIEVRRRQVRVVDEGLERLVPFRLLVLGTLVVAL